MNAGRWAQIQKQHAGNRKETTINKLWLQACLNHKEQKPLQLYELTKNNGKHTGINRQRTNPWNKTPLEWEGTGIWWETQGLANNGHSKGVTRSNNKSRTNKINTSQVCRGKQPDKTMGECEEQEHKKQNTKIPRHRVQVAKQECSKFNKSP